jgi:signal transduction histidine kinase
MLDYHSTSKGMKLRLAGFVLAIAAMVTLIAWIAHTSWSRSGELSERLTAVQLQSFQIADHFQKSILELNNLVLRFGVYGNRADWDHFESASKALDKWIDDERPLLGTEKEKQVLDKINAAYDDYMAAARQIGQRGGSNSAPAAALADFAGFEAESQRVLGLGFNLANAHRESMNSFLADSKRSLNYLRGLLLVSLTLLLLAFGGLAVVIYGELIAPLRVKLVEHQALIERQEKLASLGMLAAGVAHEIRNPLTAIKAWLFLQQKGLQAGSPEAADAQVISNEITRLERIVKDVLLFARPSEPHLATLPASEPLKKVQALLGPELQESNIRLDCEPNGADPFLRIDCQQIQQVLINLIQNAAESIGRNGQISLRARPATQKLREQTREVVVLEVSDSGKGISPEVEKRLFDPFFTTKETGTGLGLSIAARIVEKHGGVLQYQTQVNHGTTFGIVLPQVKV